MKGSAVNLDIFYIDAFTRERFKGNTAAVVPLTDWLPDASMQAIASENNLSETAFALERPDGTIHLRWFSPLAEVDFCGHATLASAFLFFQRRAHAGTLHFWAPAVGDLPVTLRADGAIVMDFPDRRPQSIAEAPTDLLAGLSRPPCAVLRNQQAYFAVYASEEDIRLLDYEREALKRLAPYDVVVTAPGQACDFVSRYFWPANGGDEDPVTGSIHAGLAPYWAERLGREVLQARQLSRRGGEIECRLENGRVKISGHAVQYLTGTLTL